MASNISQNTLPALWSSANDDVIYMFSFNPYSIDNVNNDGGSLQIHLENDFDIEPLPGEYIYINSDVYTGTFKVLAVSGTNLVTIATAYISGITTHIYNCYHLRVPTFTLYKGFKTGEDFPNELPYTKVVDIKPSVLYDVVGLPYLEINIKALTGKLFSITSNTIANSIDHSMFNGVRLTWDGLSTSLESGNDFNCVLNCAITNDELIEYFTSVSVHSPLTSACRFLTPIDKPLISSSGVSFVSGFTIVTVIIGVFPAPTLKVYPMVYKFINGIQQ